MSLPPDARMARRTQRRSSVLGSQESAWTLQANVRRGYWRCLFFNQSGSKQSRSAGLGKAQRGGVTRQGSSLREARTTDEILWSRYDWVVAPGLMTGFKQSVVSSARIRAAVYRAPVYRRS